MIKKLTTLLLACLCLPLLAQAQESEGTLISYQYGTTDRPIRYNSLHSGSAIIYSSQEFAKATNNADKFTIKKLIYPLYQTFNTPSVPIELNVFMKITSETTMTTTIPSLSEFTSVYSGNAEFDGTSAMVITLDHPFVVESGQNVMIAMSANNSDTGTLQFEDPYSSDGPGPATQRSVYYSSDTDPWNFSTVTGGPTNALPGLKIAYVLGDDTQSGGGDNGDNGDEPEAKTGTVISYNSDQYERPINGTWTYSGSQMLFVHEDLAAAADNASQYTIIELVYPLNGQSSEISCDVALTVYAKTTSDTSLDQLAPISEFTKVFEGNATFNGTTEMVVKLDKPILMSNSDNLIVAMSAYCPEYNMIKFENCFGEDSKGPNTNRTISYTSTSTPWDFVAAGAAPEKKLAGLKITYLEGDQTQGGSNDPEPTYVDLTVEALTGSTKVSKGSTGNYIVRVKNLGNEAAENYTVEIFNTETEDVLATVTDGFTVYAGLTSNVNAEITFAEEGTYTLGARVIFEDEENTENNVFDGTLTVEVVDKGFLANPASMTVPSNGEKVSYDFTYTQNGENSGAQILLAPSYFGDFSQDLQIQRIGFQVAGTLDFDIKTPVKISVAQTDKAEGYPASASMTSADLVPETDFTKVYEGIIEFKKNTSGNYTPCDVELDEAFVLEKGKGLAINIEAQLEKFGPTVYLRAADVENNDIAYFRTYKDVTLYSVFDEESATGIARGTSNTVPVVDLTYALVPLPDKTDLTVDAVEIPQDVVAGEEATYRVTVKNAGTLNVEEITVDLLDMTDETNPTVLASNEVQRMLGAGATTVVNVKYAFAEAGNYKIAARVSNDDDEDATNNIGEVYTVTVAAAPVTDLEVDSFTGNNKIFTDEANAYTVNVKNAGNTAVDSYKVEILNGETVLASKEVSEALAADADAQVTLEVTLSEEGNYTLTAVVTGAGDSNADNNSKTLDVTAEKKGNSVNGIFSDSAFSYDGGTLHIEGADAITVSDLAGRVLASAKGDELSVNLANGVYVIAVEINGIVKSAKLNIK